MQQPFRFSDYVVIAVEDDAFFIVETRDHDNLIDDSPRRMMVVFKCRCYSRMNM
jgi:hypothetical protein